MRGFGLVLGILWYDVFRLRRKIILENLGIAFPQMSDREKKRLARISTYRMGESFFESFLVPGLTQSWLEKHVVFHGLDELKYKIDEGKGVYLLGMHLGNGDLTGSCLSMKGIEVHLISKFFKNKLINDLWFYIRGAQGVKFIEPHGAKTPFEILKAIKAKATVAFVLDQFMGRPYAVENYFFGRKTGTAYGLALFYLKTKSPVMPVYAYEGKDSKYHIVVEPALDLQVGPDKDQNILNLTQKFNDAIEAAIRKHPEDWMWVHRRWKEYE